MCVVLCVHLVLVVCVWEGGEVMMMLRINGEKRNEMKRNEKFEV